MAEVGQAMQLDFHQAMQDFRTMFPDMDADVIEAVLRANHGAVHATIDQLLTMATDAEFQGTDVTSSSLLDNPSCDSNRGMEGASNFELPPSYSLSATPPPSYHQAVPSPHRSPLRGSQDRSKFPLRVSRNWNPPLLLPLPSDFLKILPPVNRSVTVLSPQRLSQRLSENAVAREAIGGSDLELAQYLKDERIALFLQNEEFLSELRSNDEFMNALQKDYEDDDAEDDHVETDVCVGRKPLRKKGESNEGTLSSLDDATFKVRIATMGKASRKKFAQIAKMFSRGKRAAGSPRSLLPGGGAANGKDLLMSPDPLIEDYDEDKPYQESGECISSSPRKFQ